MTDLLKLFLFGTFVSVASVLFALVDSVGGLMYEQGPDIQNSWTRTVPSRAPSGGVRAKKGIGS